MNWYPKIMRAWLHGPESVYGPDRMPVTPAAVLAMRETVSRWVDAGLMPAPTEAQWQMILCDHPSACVSAAAGSGKSTTLVLRVLFMVHFLNISADTLTVFSFTRASCADLRQALQRWSLMLGMNTPWQSIVSTFHSRLTQMMRIHGECRFFELLGPASANTSLPPNLLVSSHLSNEQHELLNQAYAACYREHPQFRHSVGEILLLQASSLKKITPQPNHVAERAQTLQQAAHYDRSLSEHLCIHLVAKQLWPQGLKTHPKHHFRVDGYPFHAQGQLSNGTLVFLDGLAQETGDGDMTPWHLRKHIIAHGCLQPYIYIRNHDDLALLQQLLCYEHENSEYSPTLPIPQCRLNLAGESTSANLQEVLLQTADFMECLGLDPARSDPPSSLKGLEHLVWKATQVFWPYFLNYLHEKHGIKTFHGAFRHTETSACMQHILIDEFQDISAQIVHWIQSCQRRLSLPCSIMAIGDDWQSIYAWRGASPQFLLNFQQHFPGHHALTCQPQLTLSENFRCAAPIVADARRLLEPVTLRTQHQVLAARPAKQDDHGIMHYCLREDFYTGIIHLIMEQLRQDVPELMVLARKKQDLAEIRKRLNTSLLKRVNLQTLHGGKGLQATVAIIVGDCLLGKSHPLRDAIYRQAGMRQSYSEALRDEAHRLAYVGVTRGMRRVFWISRTPDVCAQGVVRYLARYHPPLTSLPKFSSVIDILPSLSQ
ncbi:MAG: UvrD-helicase domain-containing protein [Pseudomonadales bacterium]|nr:UvrD-helicase domain-containing protein [Pseudomonadales bacterium]